MRYPLWSVGGVFFSDMQKGLEPCTFTQCLAPRTARPEASHQQALGTECFGKSDLYVSARKGDLSSLENLASTLSVEALQIHPHISTHKVALSTFGS